MICEKDKCTGCFACYNICPRNAIIMKEDEFGYVYPEIEEDKCIHCNLCKKICPSLNRVTFYQTQKCYAVYSKNSQIRNKSTSGGIATTLSQYIIENKGIVYGAAFTEEGNVEHIRVSQKEDLYRLQGSKYVHSYINQILPELKQDLESDKLVLFVGTPCQIAGVRKFLNKDYSKLILVDIICHGVPSQKYLKDAILNIKGNLNLDRVNFRKNNQYQFQIIQENREVCCVPIEKSSYVEAFIRTITLRENCYHCMYASKERVSDITIGDFWGLSKESKLYNQAEKGVSVMLVQTDKGKEILQQCSNLFEMEERLYEEAIKGNSQLKAPAIQDKFYERFRRYYPKYGFEKAYDKVSRLFRLKARLRKMKYYFRKAKK